MLLECTNEELVEIDEKISNTETIYSMVSIKEGKENPDSENKDLINDLAELEFLGTEFMDINGKRIVDLIVLDVLNVNGF